MGTASTVGAANRSRCSIGLCPCLFGGTGFDQKKTLVVHAVVLPSHPLDHLVSDINRIKRHIAFDPQGIFALGVFASQTALTRRQLLSNIEQFGKELINQKTSQAPPI